MREKEEKTPFSQDETYLCCVIYWLNINHFLEAVAVIFILLSSIIISHVLLFIRDYGNCFFFSIAPDFLCSTWPKHVPLHICCYFRTFIIAWAKCLHFLLTSDFPKKKCLFNKLEASDGLILPQYKKTELQQYINWIQQHRNTKNTFKLI